MPGRPNFVIIMTDQQRADVCAREGFPLDTTPFIDQLARQGTWFHRAYTSNPTCLPARVSLLTGRFPGAHRARTNHNGADATYEKDLFDVMRENGYATGLSGKNHSHVTNAKLDFARHFGHSGGQGEDRTEQEKAFDAWLDSLHHRAAMEPTPFPVECQGPFRAVGAATKWIDSLDGRPFFLWLSFAEPHNPYQAPEPYFSLFPPESLPPTCYGVEALETKGFKFQYVRRIGERAFPDYAEQLIRARANYCGMLRLIDDQVKRFVTHLEQRGLRDNTHIVFLSDHGDFVGEYGLVRKGPELPELLTRIPLQWTGPGVQAAEQPHPAHVSIVDIMPTICECIGVDLPAGVQGRSLWPLLTGAEYPQDEFASAYAELGFGGLHYTADDDPRAEEDGLNPNCSFDCLNRVTQSGTMRMVRKGEWKLIFDMMGRGQLYNLEQDPLEMQNLYDDPEAAAVQGELLADLLAWTLRAQDPLPLPRRRYAPKNDPRNWWAPYRKQKGCVVS